MTALLNSSFVAKLNKLSYLIWPKDIGGVETARNQVVLIFSLFLSPDAKCELLRTGPGSVCLIP